MRRDHHLPVTCCRTSTPLSSSLKSPPPLLRLRFSFPSFSFYSVYTLSSRIVSHLLIYLIMIEVWKGFTGCKGLVLPPNSVSAPQQTHDRVSHLHRHRNLTDDIRRSNPELSTDTPTINTSETRDNNIRGLNTGSIDTGSIDRYNEDYYQYDYQETNRYLSLRNSEQFPRYDPSRAEHQDDTRGPARPERPERRPEAHHSITMRRDQQRRPDRPGHSSGPTYKWLEDDPNIGGYDQAYGVYGQRLDASGRAQASQGQRIENKAQLSAAQGTTDGREGGSWEGSAGGRAPIRSWYGENARLSLKQLNSDVGDTVYRLRHISMDTFKDRLLHATSYRDVMRVFFQSNPLRSDIDVTSQDGDHDVTDTSELIGTMTSSEALRLLQLNRQQNQRHDAGNTGTDGQRHISARSSALDDDYNDDDEAYDPAALRRQLEDWTRATDHFQEMKRVGDCRVPAPELVPIRQIYPRPNRLYLPECTLVYRCRPQIGCCNSTSECDVKASNAITRSFYEIEFQLLPNGTQLVSPTPTIRNFTFTNHTECYCKSVNILSMANQYSSSQTIRKSQCARCPYPFVQTAADNSSSCSCGCRSAAESSADDSESLPGEIIHCRDVMEGRSPLSGPDARCVREGRCAKPSCAHGEFEEDIGSCPCRNGSRCGESWEPGPSSDNTDQDLSDADIAESDSIGIRRESNSRSERNTAEPSHLNLNQSRTDFVSTVSTTAERETQTPSTTNRIVSVINSKTLNNNNTQTTSRP